MTATALGLWGIVLLLAMLIIRIPVALAMFFVGFVGIWALNGWNAAMGLLASESFTLASNPELVVIPLFILMGNIATETGLSRKLYEAAYAWIGHWRGGLASATVVGSGGFAALSGSSVASALTMGRVSLGEMDRFGYSPRLSCGAVAAGGTLGILIPPSTGFVLYAILTQQSIGRLFLAGVLPGLILIGLFIATILILTTIKPSLGPKGPVSTWAERGRATIGALPLILCAFLVLGCFMEGFAMLVLTMPVFFPVVLQLGYDPIWFGVICVIMLETGLITPPVGMNVFIVKSVAPNVELNEIFRGVWPFLISILALVALLIAVPDIALLLPNTMMGVAQ